MVNKEILSEYAKLQLRQIRFEVVEYVAEERSKIFFSAFVTLLGFLLLLFGSLFAANYLNSLLDSESLGFGIMFSFWGLLFLVAFLMRENIKNFIKRTYLNNNIPK